jgi:hypothetical protein
LARRSISDPTEIAHYVCYRRRGTRLRELVRVVGSCWAVEESFQTAKNEVGLDHYQVRRYDAWYPHSTLAMLAAAFFAATRAHEAVKGRPAERQTRSFVSAATRFVAYSKLVLIGQTVLHHVRHWSTWRRRCQAQAKASHYRKRDESRPVNSTGARDLGEEVAGAASAVRR